MSTNSYDELEHFLRCQLLEDRKDAHLTQERMAEQLDISPRAMSNLEGGHNTFGLQSFLRFYLRFHLDKESDRFWNNIKDIIDRIDNESA